MPARPPRIVVDVVVVVVLTDVDASAERANDAIVYPLPRSSTPRALASSSFSDVVVLCRRPSSFARSRTPGPRADDVDRSVGRSVGQILVVVVVVRAVRTVVLILHNGPFILTHTHTSPPFLPRRARVRPSPYVVVDARATRRVSRVRRSIASLRPGRYFDLICFDRRRRRSLSASPVGIPRRAEDEDSAVVAKRRTARRARDVRFVRSSDSFVRFVRSPLQRLLVGGLEDWRIGGSRRPVVVFRVPCSVFARAIDG